MPQYKNGKSMTSENVRIGLKSLLIIGPVVDNVVLHSPPPLLYAGYPVMLCLDVRHGKFNIHSLKIICQLDSQLWNCTFLIKRQAVGAPSLKPCISRVFCFNSGAFLFQLICYAPPCLGVHFTVPVEGHWHSSC